MDDKESLTLSELEPGAQESVRDGQPITVND